MLAFLLGLDLQRRVKKALNPSHFDLQAANTGEECSRFARSTRYEALLVDAEALVFAEVLVLIQRLRQENTHAALFVFARSLDLKQRLSLFVPGADDCVRAPFFASELAVRLRLSIRLHQAASDPGAARSMDRLRSGDLELDLIRRKAIRQGKNIRLRPKEFLLLEYLVRNVNRPVTRTMILKNVWTAPFEGLTNVVDVYISSLRNKVDRDFSQKLIRTNRGIGYTLTGVGTLAVAAAGRTEEKVDIANAP